VYIYDSFKNKYKTKERTISYHENYVQVGFYQNFIKSKEEEIQKLKKQLDFSIQENKVLKSKLKFTLEAKDVLEAKLEVQSQNLLTL